MNRNSTILLFFGVAVVLMPRHASDARSTDEQVKRLTQRYDQIEAQLDRSVHYLQKTEANGATTIGQAWIDGTGDLIKVAVERTDPSGRELTEYSGDFFHREMFMLTRKEVRLPDGGTQVDESRDYFSNDGDLIRKLTKSAHFKAGESTDTKRVPNVVVDLPRPHAVYTQEEREKTDSVLDHWKGTVANLCGKTSPRVSAAILEKASLFVGHDSGPMHLASAVGTPCVAIFSAQNPPGQWFPRGDKNRILLPEKLCSVCAFLGCRQINNKCILSITVDQVHEEIKRQLETVLLASTA